MDNYKHPCPVCKEKGITTFLQLRQINFTTAVYLCKDTRCRYPEGHSWIYEDRKLSDEDDDSDSDLYDSVNDDIDKMILSMSDIIDLNSSTITKYEKERHSLPTVECENIQNTEKDRIDLNCMITKNEKECLSFPTVECEDTHNIEKNTIDLNRSSITVHEKECHSLPTVELEDTQNTDTIDFNCSTIIKNENECHSLPTLECKDTKNTEKISCEKESDGTEGNFCGDVIYVESTNEVTNVVEISDDSNAIFSNLLLSRNTNLKNDLIAIENEVKNVIIDVPNELFSTVELPSYDANVTNSKYKVLATGSRDKEVVDVAVPQDSKLQFDIVHQNENSIKIDISIPNLTQNQSKKNLIFIDPQTGVSNKLTQVQKPTLNQIRKLNLSQNMRKVVTLPKSHQNKTFKHKSENITTKIGESQSKVVALSKSLSKNVNENVNLQPEKNKIKTAKHVTQGKSKIANTKNNFNKNVKTKPENKIFQQNSSNKNIEMKPANKICEPNSFAYHANYNFDPVYKVKFKSKKEKPKFHIPAVIIDNAMKTLQQYENTVPKKKVEVINGKNNSNTPKKNTASNFEGFKFSTKVIQPARSVEDKAKQADEEQNELKDYLKTTKARRNRKNSDIVDVESDEEMDISSIVTSDRSHSSASTDTSVKGKTDFVLEDLTLNQLLDNIDAVNVPNPSADISEVDKWLDSICQF